MKRLFIAAGIIFAATAGAATLVPSSLIQWVAPVSIPSPNLTGTPTAPTAAGTDASTQIATTAFVAGNFAKKGANTDITSLNAPALGAATATTAAAGDNTTKVATTAYVRGVYAAPPAIGSTTPAAGSFTTLSASGNATVTGTLTVNGNPGWTAYTPTLAAQSGTFTSATANGAYYKVGGLVFYRALVQITTVGTASGAVLVGLPFTSNSGTASGPLALSGRDNSTGKALVGTFSAGATAATVLNYDNTSPVVAGAQMIISGTMVAN
ncbi:hypothetical protein CAL26_10015 [Bordetella genomosp. 9]|uniref:Uncharacterized protein n=1 Tax=Bordetella genomosp. 9 TaxID=1416803 RepID=A0A261RFE3_9BORD|nr:hypothetical protein [Bordetella genomosp. 9]OZI23756.1 hypothetical protein CAL26_10015 [Bordetella genomosp. 9]